ncbi:MAG: hypothetical protein CMA63_02880 [Euryarchaeota archaeon]|nr:hypothetical protein [Euryarchaeota archaeon]|tara:strand:+ start:9390 stop:10250 length:861 start_codon:yes stop_codon:yes gene_type:complete
MVLDFFAQLVLIAFVLFIVLPSLIWLIRVRPKQPVVDDDWNSDCEFITTAEITDEAITFSNVRNFFWRTTRDRDEAWIDSLTVKIDELKDIWFMVDHFHSIHGMAHTYLTFEFNDGTCLSFSFEARRRKKQRYHPWPGLWRNFELYLLVGMESDLTGLRTNGRGNKDYMFRAITPPEKDKHMLVRLAQKANQLAEKPEWYHSLLTTCNTSIVRLVNRVTPGRVPFLWRNFLPGYTPRAALKLGLIEDWGGLESTLEQARIDEVAREWDGEGSYSEMLRQHLPDSQK